MTDLVDTESISDFALFICLGSALVIHPPKTD